MKSDNKKSIALFISCIGLFIYYIYASKWSSKEYSNIKIYVGSACIFFLILIIFNIFLKKVNFSIQEKSIIKLNWISGILFILGVGWWLFKAYQAETTNWPYYPTSYIRHLIPMSIYFFILIICSIFIVIYSYSFVKKSSSLRF